ncbi:MAG: ABC transporter permease [Clostridiales bacterium]|nr:ABC transporter permease [Clostridiales bacterium]
MSISSLLSAMPGAISQGVLWGVMVLGLYITFKVLDYADLTVDGSFATGGAVSAILIVNGWDPFLCLLISFLSGMVAGLSTGFLSTKVKIPPILAGILTQIALYSINIRIMGKANIPLLKVETAFSKIQTLLESIFKTTIDKNLVSIIFGAIIVLIIVFVLYWFFGTELGSAIRATGNNEYMIRALGVNTDITKILGLMFSNGLVALSGAMVAQNQGYADVGMGTGAIVIGLAAVIIGEVIFGRRFSFAYRLMSVVFGSIIYRIIITIVLQLGFKSTDLKLLTAILVAIALSIPVIQQKIRERFGKQIKPENNDSDDNDNENVASEVKE